MGKFSVSSIRYLQNVQKRYLIPLGIGSMIYFYACLIRQSASNDEIDVSMGSFGLRIYIYIYISTVPADMTFCFDDRTFSDMNNTNLII